jgi:hypothetical protein
VDVALAEWFVEHTVIDHRCGGERFVAAAGAPRGGWRKLPPLPGGEG